MARFIKCSVTEVNFNGSFFSRNDPLNIDLCRSIHKSEYEVYTDFPHAEYRPSIVFVGVSIEWIYPDEESRDKDYERIVNNLGGDRSVFTDEQIAILKGIIYEKQTIHKNLKHFEYDETC